MSFLHIIVIANIDFIYLDIYIFVINATYTKYTFIIEFSFSILFSLKLFKL